MSLNQSSVVAQANQLYQQFLSIPESNYIDRYNVPFPFAVFGTLRSIPSPHCNSRRMFAKEPVFHCKAFLPHFAPSGLRLGFHEGAAGVFEVYFYTPENWNGVIRGVDSLEGFSPQRTSDYDYGYNRTLMNVRLLPDDYEHKFFSEGLYERVRDLRIPEEEWENYPKVPCWLYSNSESNRASLREVAETTPLLWSR